MLLTVTCKRVLLTSLNEKLKNTKINLLLHAITYVKHKLKLKLSTLNALKKNRIDIAYP